MQPCFESYVDGLGAELKCPSCGFNYLHHDRVEIFECGEDAEEGIHVDVTEGKVLIDKKLLGNPSSRRHGLKVHFWCEGCSAKPIMRILQHKGNTYINFD
jgi:hypothetical protein